MYIRKTVKHHQGKTYVNHLLVESAQTPQGPRQRVICSLGSLAPAPRKQWLWLARKLEAALSGRSSSGRSSGRGATRGRARRRSRLGTQHVDSD